MERIKGCEDLELLRDLQPSRARAEGASEPLTTRILAASGAGGGSTAAGIWMGFNLNSGGWSREHPSGKPLLLLKTWTTPTRDPHASWVASQLLWLANSLMGDWLNGKLESRYDFTDSGIALAWTVYDSARLLPFLRHRVNANDSIINNEEKSHGPGQSSPPDAGTNIKDVSASLETRNANGALGAPKFQREVGRFVVCLMAPESDKYEDRRSFNAKTYTTILPPKEFCLTFAIGVYAFMLRFLPCLKKTTNSHRSNPIKDFGLEEEADSTCKIFVANNTDACTNVKKTTNGHRSNPIKNVAFEEKADNTYRIFVANSTDVCTNPSKEPHITDHCSSGNVAVGKEKDYNSQSKVKRFPGQPDKWVPTGEPRFSPHGISEVAEIKDDEEDFGGDLAFIYSCTSQEVAPSNNKEFVHTHCAWSNSALPRKGRVLGSQAHIAIFACVGTGRINFQVVGSQPSTGLMEAAARFAMEAGTPATVTPDKQTGLGHLFNNVEVTLKASTGQLYKEHGITFFTCPSQAHFQGIGGERVARAVHESNNRAQFTKERLHILGWQPFARSIEGIGNDTPIGYVTHNNNEVAETLQALSAPTWS